MIDHSRRRDGDEMAGLDWYGRAAIAVICAMALGMIASKAQASHGLPLGGNFGVAESHNDAVNDPQDEALDVEAPAFPSFTPPGWPRPKAFWMGVCDLENPDTGGTGVGAPPLIGPVDCIDHGTAYTLADALNPDPPRETTWMPGEEPSWRLDSLSQAGAHPDVTVSFWVQRYPHNPFQEFGTSHQITSDGDVKNAIVKLPPGFLGNPNALPRCDAERLHTTPPSCPPETQVGTATVTTGEGGVNETGGTFPPTDQRVPVWNVEPRKGKLAEFIFSANASSTGRLNVPIVARARTDGDFGIDTLALNLPAALPVLGTTVTFWGVPFAASHDKYRPPESYVADGQSGIPEAGLPDISGNQPQPYEPDWGPVQAFLTSQTECSPQVPSTTLQLESWHDQGNVKSYVSPLDALKDGCEKLPFDPDMDIASTTTVADAPSGLDVALTLPQNLDPKDAQGDPLPTPSPGATQPELDAYVAAANAHWRSDEGLGTSMLKDAVVSLSSGLSLNTSAASGLAGCSDAQIGLVSLGPPAVFDNSDPLDKSRPVASRCPEGSIVGQAHIHMTEPPGRAVVR